MKVAFFGNCILDHCLWYKFRERTHNVKQSALVRFETKRQVSPSVRGHRILVSELAEAICVLRTSLQDLRCIKGFPFRCACDNRRFPEIH